MSKTIYFAGPDVFNLDYDNHKKKIKQYCQRYGMTPLLPADTEIVCDDPLQLAKLIYQQNIQYIQLADIVVANVSSFRGYEPDSGTMFEVGFAIASGKTVWCYQVPDKPLIDIIPQREPGIDSDDHIVEDFGLPLNLMIASSCHLFQGDVFALLTKLGQQ